MDVRTERAHARAGLTEEWEAVHQVVPWGDVPDRNFEKFVLENFRMTSARFLDLGCGAGAQAIWLAGRCHTVTAIDASPAALDRLKERVERRDDRDEVTPRLWTMAGDLTKFPEHIFGQQTFDCALDVCCLQHMTEDDAVALVQKVRKWLKPGGCLWSKQAIAPFDPSLNRVSFIRLADMESIRRTFRGYEVKMDMIREIVRGDKDLWSVIIQARVSI